MTLLDKIREAAITARRAQDPLAPLFVTLIGEAEGASKRLSPARELNDDEVLAIVRKFIKNMDETIGHLSADATRAAPFVAQRDALAAYLPKQMTADEIRAFAEARKVAGDNLGQIMGALKAERGGQYDGKLASQIVRETLA